MISVQDHPYHHESSYSTIWDDPLALVFVNMNVKIVVCDCGKTYKMSPEMARKYYQTKKIAVVPPLAFESQHKNICEEEDETGKRY